MRLISFLLAGSLFTSSSAAQIGNVGIGTTTPSDQLHTTGAVRFQQYAGGAEGTRLVRIDSVGRLVVPGPTLANTGSGGISDNGCASNSGALRPISISGLPTSVPLSRLAVRVNIIHPYVGDLRVFLFAPSGHYVALMAGVGASGDNMVNTVFSDAAPTNITSAIAPFTGVYRPHGSTTILCGLGSDVVGSFAALGNNGNINPNGTWNLWVFDAASGDAGSFVSWELTFAGSESFATDAAANYLPRFTAEGDLQSSKIYQSPVNGNVGVGTTTPLYALDVTGNLRATTNAVVGGNIRISGGTPNSGDVLTATNTAGDATWQPLPASPRVAFRASLDAGTTLPFPGNYILHFDDTSGNSGFSDGGGFVPNNYGFVAPADGVYSFETLVYLNNANVAGGDIWLQIVNTNTNTNNGPKTVVRTTSTTGLPGTISASAILKLTAGDLVRVRLENYCGSSISTVGGAASQFWGARIY